MIKILHTADIHLDSVFSSLDISRAEVRRNELRAAFTSMMTYAKMNNVDMIVIAGDVFDGEYVTRETIALLQREFKNFGKPIFISPGNHDSVKEKSIWKKKIFPENVHVFVSDHIESFELDNPAVTVYGYAFTDMNMTSSPLRESSVTLAEDRINILVGHCDIVAEGGHSTNCPVTAGELAAFGADYCALGHIHNNPPADPEGKWCYPGCLEPRSFDETGPKGACMVEINKNGGTSHVTVKRVRFSKRRYELGELILDGQDTNGEISEKISQYIRENRFGEDTLLSLKLKGYVSPSLVVDTDFLEQKCSEVFFLKLTDCTRPEIDLSLLEKDPGIKGDIYRRLKPSIDSDDQRTHEVALRALRYSLSALYEDSVF